MFLAGDKSIPENQLVGILDEIDSSIRYYQVAFKDSKKHCQNGIVIWLYPDYEVSYNF